MTPHDIVVQDAVRIDAVPLLSQSCMAVGNCCGSANNLYNAAVAALSASANICSTYIGTCTLQVGNGAVAGLDFSNGIVIYRDSSTGKLVLSGAALEGDVTITGGLAHTGGGLGFYGTAIILQQTLPTGAGKTVDNVITALQNLGLVKQA
jgi:hypothetical protein